MLDTQSLEWLMTCERLKDEAVTVERQCEAILRRFEHLDHEPTPAERDARRREYQENRSRLAAINDEIRSISRRAGARQ